MITPTREKTSTTPLEPTIRHEKITEVAAAVFLRPAADMGQIGRTEFLLAQRPPGKAYAGYWEFPGGKREPGESLIDTCRRELHEELGVHCEWIEPWINREFVYPHAHVRIRFFRIRRWRGELHPHEHTGLCWVGIGETPEVSPVLPANGPILDALALPTTYAITCAELHGVEAELQRVRQALAVGCRMFQIRDKSLPTEIRARFATEVMAMARPHRAIVLVNETMELARECGADGVHLTAAQLRRLDHRPDFGKVGASCHNAAELEQAVALGADFAVLGPVLPTKTHPDTTPLGWPHFSQLLEHCPIPVFALGGIRPGMQDLAAEHGGHGVALMRSWPGQAHPGETPPTHR